MRRNAASGLALLALLCAVAALCPGHALAGEEAAGSPICRPVLHDPPTIELGNAGIFKWTCKGGKRKGSGFYIVFIRPSKTYVLLKVPRGRTTFEFTPDTPGLWRWIVINTDPDRTRPDLESEAGFFHVIRTEKSEP